jgi:hypothetical protein
MEMDLSLLFQGLCSEEVDPRCLSQRWHWKCVPTWVVIVLSTTVDTVCPGYVLEDNSSHVFWHTFPGHGGGSFS